MATNFLVINVALRETRVALIESGVIAELHIERASRKGTVGNIVLGKVTRVLPGMQAAFIDVGQERAAFLHVEDLIRPDDFENYLLSQGDVAPPTADELEREDGDDDDADGDDDSGDDDSGDDDSGDDDSGDDGSDDAAEDEDSGDDSADEENGTESRRAAPRRRRVVTAADKKPVAREDDDSDDDGDADDESSSERDDGDDDSDADDDDKDERDDDKDERDDDKDERDDDDEDGSRDGSEKAEADADDEDGAPDKDDDGDRTAASERDDDRDDRGRRRRRRRRKKGGTSDGRRNGQSQQGRGSKKGNARNKRQSRKQQLRAARSVPITEVVKEGDDVVVQISKEPIGTKGARVTSHVSLAGRYVVYVPTMDHIGVSKRIGSPRERTRLRQVIESVKPPKGGLVVRTLAEGLTKKGLKTDVGYLVRTWEQVSKNKETAKPTDLLYEELDLVLKTVRDQFSDDIDKIIIDDKDQYNRMVRFMEMFMPDRVSDIELYSGDEPIYDAYGIEDEIGRALSRKVPLPSGGYLIIDQAEALTAIDVNTGRYVGKGSKDLEETAFKTNLEAVEEIAYQLRFRNIGGLVILDLIDMERAGNRDKVLRALERLLAKDKAKTTLQRISELGLVEMTRKRTRESLGRLLHEPCFYCDGTGQIQSRETIAYEILRQVRRERHTLQGYSVTVNAHPAIVDLLQNEEKQAVEEAERRLMRRIEFTPRKEYHIEQFDLQGR